jgi:hypothetical protein
MEAAVNDVEPIELGDHRHAGPVRRIAAVACGILSGFLITNSLWVGFFHVFSDEQDVGNWRMLIWGEHWAVRTAASIASTAGSCILAGLIGRRRGGLVGALSAAPTVLSWTAAAVLGWMGETTVGGQVVDFDVSLGNKLAAMALVVLTLPVAVQAGRFGAEIGEGLAAHFDSRRHSLLGIRWFHYAWLPPLIHLWLAQAAWAGFYTFVWITALIRAGREFNPFAGFVPMVFTGLFYCTFWIMAKGAVHAYLILAGFKERPSAAARAGAVITYGVGAQVLAAALQAATVALQFGLATLLNRS